MIYKDLLRLIIKTFRRFISILLIVFIGTGFMMGLYTSNDVLRRSVDNYYDQQHFFDIQVYSSYGFCKEDIEELGKLDGLKSIYPSRFVDAYTSDDNNVTFVTRIEELHTANSQLELVEGRMPIDAKEALCLSTSSFGAYYGIGDTVYVLNQDGELDDELKYDEFTIVGLAKNPLFLCSSKDTSTLDNKNIDAVIFVHDSVFTSDTFKTVYLEFEDSASLVSFTDKYQSFIDDRSEEVSDLAHDQQDYYKNQLIEEYKAEIQKGEQELKDKSAKADKEFADAKKKLDDAYLEIKLSEMTLETNEKTLDLQEEELKKQEALLISTDKQVNDAIKQVEEQSGTSFDETFQTVEAAYYAYTALQYSTENSSRIDESIARIDEQIAANNA
ncbi:MAG: hypothetical protein IKE33_05470, partial [Erysipelotrichaceae bacterium]|nr:hypothetical protein [Erysipelotrichaceae bacterium]